MVERPMSNYADKPLHTKDLQLLAQCFFGHITSPENCCQVSDVKALGRRIISLASKLR